MRSLALFSALWLIWITASVKGSELGSVSFLESTPGSYLRIAPSESLQGDTFSVSDVSAATSVLLGSAPLPIISDESASKLNELLVPNPFHRPRAVLLLTLEQVKPWKLRSIASEKKGTIGSIVAHHRELQVEVKTSTVLLPEDALLLSLNTTVNEVSKSTIADTELKELALFLGGFYEASKEPSTGVLSLELPDGDMVTLDLEKEEHRSLVLKLSAFFHHVQAAAQTLDSPSGVLVVGTLTVSKDLYEASDSSITSTDASGLLHLVVAKVFAHLDRVLNGGLVAVVIYAQKQSLDVKFNSGPLRLQLLQTSSDTTAVVAEVLTETIIAYITGILVIVALIIGKAKSPQVVEALEKHRQVIAEFTQMVIMRCQLITKSNSRKRKNLSRIIHHVINLTYPFLRKKVSLSRRALNQSKRECFARMDAFHPK
ncbi:hypothetical protein GOP47_0005227 [Adiantum capillus-veneris]|uniref:DUF7794 domain-containing protein n=1 Tax=Adiantum capillus-veneris TaxID=13818 RepID=A0A9D4ZL68_ADICA|nr:hypothetical protein GOP47_0005227 [Adiantum capillus-veneris]